MMPLRWSRDCAFCPREIAVNDTAIQVEIGWTPVHWQCLNAFITRASLIQIGLDCGSDTTPVIPCWVAEVIKHAVTLSYDDLMRVLRGASQSPQAQELILDDPVVAFEILASLSEDEAL